MSLGVAITPSGGSPEIRLKSRMSLARAVVDIPIGTKGKVQTTNYNNNDAIVARSDREMVHLFPCSFARTQALDRDLHITSTYNRVCKLG